MSRKRPQLASAIVELRTSFGESQQKFSERLGVALATVGRWEIGDRQPSLRSLKELWHLAAEQDLPALQKIFADAFTLGAGYQLSAGPQGFEIRNRISDANARVSKLLPKVASAEDREEVAGIMSELSEVSRLMRELDLEPPFRSVVQIKGKNKK
jgi:transcriptional regulator with XRE-family HTH domain